MKKQQTRKLQLSKETLRELRTFELEDAAGGVPTTTCTIITIQVSIAISCFQGHCPPAM